jgi:hypothetical protein
MMGLLQVEFRTSRMSGANDVGVFERGEDNDWRGAAATLSTQSPQRSMPPITGICNSRRTSLGVDRCASKCSINSAPLEKKRARVLPQSA